ncbi:catechol 2,3-dioxygenase-like lactoylglutathione lyase family enzyme [Breoghania corrubedonensis]|uniref:Catechol 2,3-dioxygenase-like lactoylglutathione lyase family enzyme n=2 Tax=Breoghania corrubedonensis TaxID=665038 RepID=A0A2T5V7D0_9HYPH|nr:catechol 2,3-dioxygenase-like lactoylglutathione lyase family enzyme [Breoghania corrubedonensis]
MSTGDYTLLYVDDISASRDFYAGMLKREPVEDGPTFVLFILDSGAKFGLWKRDEVQPPAGPRGGHAGECCFSVADEATLERIFGDVNKRGLPIAQAPSRMDFGYTFVLLDPDGNRLRVFAPAMAPAS